MAALSGSVSKRYARALFSLGVDNGKFEEYGEQLATLATAYRGSSELRHALDSPVFKPSEKRKLVEALLAKIAPSAEFQRFILLILDRGRLPFLPNISRDFQRMSDERKGQVRGTVTTATPLDPATFARVQQALEKRTGRKVILQAKLDPELIGGVVAQVGDLVMDGSLRHRLADLSKRLLN